MATEFAISRFCVPFLQETGWALFVDCDIVCLDDIGKLFAEADERYAVMVVKHLHEPLEVTKMDGQIQTGYPRKNWSSVMLWNCSHEANLRLTKERLNRWPGRDLHAFKWLEDEQIGDLRPVWNFLVGVDEPLVDTPEGIFHRQPKILHYTNGGPWLPNWQGGPYDKEWLREQAAYKAGTHA